MANNLAPLDAFQKAKGRLLFNHIFWSYLILRTPIIFTTQVARAETDMKVIYINPKFSAKLSVKVNMFVLAHEAAHIMLKHGLRVNGRKHRVWNWACDFAINLMLKKAGFELWEHCLINHEFEGMSAEQIYPIVLKDPKKYVCKNPNGPKKKLAPPGIEADDDEDAEFDDILDPEILDEAEKRKLEREINTKVAAAWTGACQAGKQPLGMDQIVQGEINPPQNWQTLFNDKMTRIIQTEASWTRRNRRYANYVLPTNSNPGMGPVVFIGDTSGSMDHHKVFPQVEYEINAMAETAHPERVVLLWGDTEVALVETFEPGDNITIHPKGGGGTAMDVLINAAAEYDPDIVVMLTDCETAWPEHAPPYKLIVLACATDFWANRVPKWAEVIRIKSAAIT